MENRDGDWTERREGDDPDERAGRALAVLTAVALVAGLLIGLLTLAISASSRTARNPLDVGRIEAPVGHLAVP